MSHASAASSRVSDQSQDFGQVARDVGLDRKLTRCHAQHVSHSIPSQRSSSERQTYPIGPKLVYGHVRRIATIRRLSML
jgi:hypothetical protein